MVILFDPNYPNYLVEALQLINKLDMSQSFTILKWDNTVKENELTNPVVFILDRKSRGVEITTRKHCEAGYRVFAMKMKKKQSFNFLDFSLTVMKLWPQMLEAAKNDNAPFVYTYRYCGKRLIKQ